MMRKLSLLSSQFLHQSKSLSRQFAARSFKTLSHRNRQSSTLPGSQREPIISTDELSTRVLYEPLEGVERLENYQPGGYHPVRIGDQYHDRYQIVHKLGHGSYSTTWLAHDAQCKKYVALKICTADSNPQEIHVLSTLKSSQALSVQSQEETMIPTILDRFNIQSPNGRHACYATILARASLSDAKNESWSRLFQLDVARALAAQLVMAVDCTHTCGLVHGDLHLGNILLKLPFNFDHLSVENLYEKYGAPELHPVVHLYGKPLPPGLPSHGIVPIWLGKASDKLTLPEARILLTDFGEAFSPSHEPKHESHTPLVIRPPEVRFEPTKALSFSSDIWSLACSIWTILAQRPLFEEFLATEDDMTCEQVDALGVLPLEWWKKWEARHERFNESGEPKNRDHFRSWEDRFEDSIQQPRRAKGMPIIEQTERDALSAMLQSMLSFQPEKRPTVKQVLNSEWMVKWAMPEYGRVQRYV